MPHRANGGPLGRGLLPLLGLGLLLAALPAASGTAQEDGSEQWNVAHGMGTTEARVENGAGAAFDIYCPSGGSDDVTPGVLVDVGALDKPVERDASYPATLRIDDEEQTWSFAYIGGRRFQFAALDSGMVDALATLVAALRRGSDLAVAIPDGGVDEHFTLRGSAAALDDLLDDCNPL